MAHMTTLSRRSFVAQVSALAGGFALGFRLPDPDGGSAAAQAVSPAEVPAEVNAWILIKPDDSIVIRVARSEMGQGAMTALPMLVAEELECDWSKVSSEYVSPDENLRRNRAFGDMSTGGSRGVRGSQDYLRRAGAVAREMLIAAAARRWDVAPAECRAERSVITHAASGRRVTFGAVAADAAGISPPQNVRLKAPGEWKLIGTRTRRLDLLEKVTGRPIYGMDVRLPGMAYGALLQSPVFGGRVAHLDDAAARAIAGVQKVVNLGDAVAVLADNTWTARKALEALRVTWDERGKGGVDSAAITAYLREGLVAAQAPVARQEGDVDAALAGAARRIEAEYGVPFLAHATMEPMNCTAQVTADKVEIWVSSQNGEASLAAAAAAAGVEPRKVVVHKMHQGGGFGRRGGPQDFVRYAVLAAKQHDRPVKLVWSREEDIRHDFYRPVAMAKLTAGLDAAGNWTALKVRIAGQSIAATMFPDRVAGNMDRSFLGGFIEDMPYAIANYRADYAMRNTHVPVGTWRSVNHSQNGFFRECFVDEVAHAIGVDPYELRRRLLAAKPIERAVLDAAAQRAGWGTPLPEGRFRGIANVECYGSYCATVAEISIDPRGRLTVHRLVTAIDSGHVVNPAIVESQMEGSAAYALTAMLYGEITIKDGKVEQGNFDDYEILRLDEMPRVETIVMPSGGFWGGIGEQGVPQVAPAVCNAIFAATGKRIRALPLKNQDLRRS